MKKILTVISVLLFLAGCTVTRQYVTTICIRGDGNTVPITVRAAVPKDYNFDTDCWGYSVNA